MEVTKDVSGWKVTDEYGCNEVFDTEEEARRWYKEYGTPNPPRKPGKKQSRKTKKADGWEILFGILLLPLAILAAICEVLPNTGNSTSSQPSRREEPEDDYIPQSTPEVDEREIKRQRRQDEIDREWEREMSTKRDHCGMGCLCPSCDPRRYENEYN